MEELLDIVANKRRSSSDLRKIVTKRLKTEEVVVNVEFGRDMTREILFRVHPSTLFSCSVVCKQWNAIMQDESFWKNVVLYNVDLSKKAPWIATQVDNESKFLKIYAYDTPSWKFVYRTERLKYHKKKLEFPSISTNDISRIVSEITNDYHYRLPWNLDAMDILHNVAEEYVTGIFAKIVDKFGPLPTDEQMLSIIKPTIKGHKENDLDAEYESDSSNSSYVVDDNSDEEGLDMPYEIDPFEEHLSEEVPSDSEDVINTTSGASEDSSSREDNDSSISCLDINAVKKELSSHFKLLWLGEDYDKDFRREDLEVLRSNIEDILTRNAPPAKKLRKLFEEPIEISRDKLEVLLKNCSYFDHLRDDNGQNILHYLARSLISMESCSYDLIKFLEKEQGLSMNDQDNRGVTPAMIAGRTRDLSPNLNENVIRSIYYALRDGKWQSSIQDNRGWCILDYWEDSIIANQAAEQIQLLPFEQRMRILARRLNRVHMYNNNELESKDWEDIDVMNLLIGDNKEEAVKWRHPEFSGDSLLHLAASKDSTSYVEALVEYGSDINARNLEGWTPFHVAVDSGLAETVTYMLEKGADLEICLPDGTTPLTLASDRKISHLPSYKNGKYYCDLSLFSEYLARIPKDDEPDEGDKVMSCLQKYMK